MDMIEVGIAHHSSQISVEFSGIKFPFYAASSTNGNIVESLFCHYIRHRFCIVLLVFHQKRDGSTDILSPATQPESRHGSIQACIGTFFSS